MHDGNLPGVVAILGDDAKDTLIIGIWEAQE